ncbi:MAG: hydroxyacid dehydrogenase [Anaerolineae bacterium]|nr:hydroxyacid dehydrogenase [Anaerolineae bacterium]
MYRILNAEPGDYSPDARAILRSLGALDERDLNRSELLAQIAAYDAVIVRLRFTIDRQVIDAAARLKAIVTATTGLDHIDMAYAERAGIAVLSLRGHEDFLESVVASAEHTWALLLALMRRVPAAHQSVLGGAWDRDAFKGHDLRGKRLGILGLGRLGGKVARYGLAFGMRVAAYDSTPGRMIEGVTMCRTQADLLRQSDVLSIHVPLDETTAGLLGGREIALLPAGAVVINTARGAILDEAALLAGLESGRLSGAALDVLAGERTRQESVLVAYARTHDNLIITPHIGGATFEAMAATEVFMAEQLRRFLAARGG